jgi:hypothetical protein
MVNTNLGLAHSVALKLAPLFNLGNELAKARILVKLDSPEIRELLKSNDVADYLLELGNKVADKAGPDYLAAVDREARKSRVVVNVLDPRPEARFVEMKTGRLARALGETSK